MPRIAPPHRNTRFTRGLTLLEVVIALLVTVVLVGVLISGFQAFQKYRLHSSSRNRLQELSHVFSSTLIEDLQTAGLGVASLSGTALVVKDAQNNGVRPTVFLNTDGTALTILATDREGAGNIVQLAASSIIVNGVVAERWTKLPAGSLVFCTIPGGGQPALVQLSAKPRKATPSDLPVNTGVVYNLKRTVVLTFAPAPVCLGAGSLSSTVNLGGQVIPVTRLVRYRSDNSGIIREESVVCGTTGNTAAQPNTTWLTPLMNQSLSFQYVTASGTSLTFPTDTSQLRGIRVAAEILDPTTSLTDKLNFDAFVEPWSTL
ncbi:MAG TPA: hypothetical protein PKE58_13210 [Acidobacteriota bacterium]|nr:hypothetical protein [Acidobacteriota bacterium]